MQNSKSETTDDARNAARYRWLKEWFYGMTIDGLYDSPGHEVGGCVSSEQFDAEIDQAIAREEAERAGR